jgi:hypothetical protein
MFEKEMKEIDVWDIGFVKATVALFTLGMIGIFPQAAVWVQSVNPIYFFLAALIMAARPIYRFWIKGEGWLGGSKKAPLV